MVGTRDFFIVPECKFAPLSSCHDQCELFKYQFYVF